MTAEEIKPEQWALELWHAADDAAAECARDEAGYPNYAAALTIQRAFEERERESGWIIGNSEGTLWRTWENGWSEWTTDHSKACRYARREDAEQAHAEDDDAWRVVPYAALATRQDAPVTENSDDR